MIILGLDTTGPDCSACLIQDNKVLAYKSETIGRGHAERLAPMVAEIFDAANIAPTKIDRLVVCTGPGSFTGLRVALSLAKGFALPNRLPILGFDAMHIRANEPEMSVDPVAIYRDVKRGEVFAAVYQNGNPSQPPQAMTLEAAKNLTGTYVEANTVDVRVMARMALEADPSSHPAEPLYARAPDAKLPGGVSL